MILSLPLSVTIPRKTKEDKVININLNVTRNLHYHVLNQCKVMWKDIVRFLLPLDKMPDPPYKFIYTVYPQSNRAFDLANVCPAVQKWTDDALIDLGVIKDDNYRHIRCVEYRFGSVDKDRPRCELEIREWRPTI